MTPNIIEHQHRAEEEAKAMVEITKAEYDELIKNQFKLQCLESGGVYNWEWYGASLKEYCRKYDPDFDESDYEEF